MSNPTRNRDFVENSGRFYNYNLSSRNDSKLTRLVHFLEIVHRRQGNCPLEHGNGIMKSNANIVVLIRKLDLGLFLDKFIRNGETNFHKQIRSFGLRVDT